MNANLLFNRFRKPDEMFLPPLTEEIPVAGKGELPIADQILTKPLPDTDQTDWNAVRQATAEQPTATPPAATPEPPAPAVTENRPASAQTLDEFNRVKSADPSEFRQSSFKKRIGSGIWRAFKQWGAAGAPGGIAGLIGAIATGGLVSGFAPGADAEARKQIQADKLFLQYGQQAEAEKLQMEQAKANAALQGQVIKNKSDALNYIRTVNKPFYDSIMADDIVTEEEAARAQELGYNIEPYDARKFNTQMINGELMTSPTLGTPNYKPTGLTDLVKTPIRRKLDDGTEVYTTGDKLIDHEIADKLNQARMDFDASKFNASDMQQYETGLTKWRDNISEAGGNVSKIDQELADLIALRSGGFDDYDGTLEQWGNLEKTIAEKKGELSKAKQVYDNLLKNPPKKPKPVSAPNLSLPKVSESTFRQQAQAKGITGASLEAAVRKAKADGVIQ